MKAPKKIFFRTVEGLTPMLFKDKWHTEKQFDNDIEYINAEEVKELEKKARCWDKLKEHVEASNTNTLIRNDISNQNGIEIFVDLRDKIKELEEEFLK